MHRGVSFFILVKLFEEEKGKKKKEDKWRLWTRFDKRGVNKGRKGRGEEKRGKEHRSLGTSFKLNFVHFAKVEGDDVKEERPCHMPHFALEAATSKSFFLTLSMTLTLNRHCNCYNYSDSKVVLSTNLSFSDIMTPYLDWKFYILCKVRERSYEGKRCRLRNDGQFCV